MSTLALLKLLTVPNIRRLDTILRGVTNQSSGLFNAFWAWYGSQLGPEPHDEFAQAAARREIEIKTAHRALTELKKATTEWLAKQGPRA